MEAALAELLALESGVVRAGPAVLGGAPAFLTDQLVVHFETEIGLSSKRTSSGPTRLPSRCSGASLPGTRADGIP